MSFHTFVKNPNDNDCFGLSTFNVVAFPMSENPIEAYSGQRKAKRWDILIDLKRARFAGNPT